MNNYYKLNIGDISYNGQITIVDEDRLCYRVQSECRGAKGIRTISKALLREFVEYIGKHPDATPRDARNALSGTSDIDKYEYGYDSTLVQMAKMVIEGVPNNIDKSTNYKKGQSQDACQIIYYGAPGTGKSHRIKAMLEGVPTENIFRTTFHPDSDYSTFVGTYKPAMEKPTEKIYAKEELISKLNEMKDGGVTYTPQKFSAKFWRSLKQLSLSDKKEILQACGMSDNYTVEFDKGVAVGEVYLASSNESRIIYSFVPQVFLKAYILAYKKPNENVYLVIEEINRGNCAQIFGDLFQLLDRDDNGVSEYKIKADADIVNYLEEKLGKDSAGIKDGELCLPSNLYIYATMNTSDQSLFPIDSAFKRRWDWEYEPIKYKNTDWAIEINGNKYSWTSFQKKVNEKIFGDTNSEDKMLGDYFVKANNDNVRSEKLFVNKVLFYLWNDVCKDGDNDIFKTDDNKDVKFSDLYGDNGTKMILGMMEHLGVELISEEVQSESEDQADEAISSTKHKKLNAVVLDGVRYDSLQGKFNLYLNVINKIGIEKVAPIVGLSKYKRLGHPLISTTKYDDIENSQQYGYEQVGDYYIVKGMNDDTKINLLELIKSKLQLDLQIEIE